jgi:hypothetical protein
MKIVITLAEQDPDAWLRASAEEQQKAFAKHRAFDTAVSARGAVLAGAALSEIADARTVHLRDGERVVTEGPYAETGEQLTGVYVVDLPDVDTAVELVQLLPEGYVIGVRPSVVLDNY